MSRSFNVLEAAVPSRMPNMSFRTLELKPELVTGLFSRYSFANLADTLSPASCSSASTIFLRVTSRSASLVCCSNVLSASSLVISSNLFSWTVFNPPATPKGATPTAPAIKESKYSTNAFLSDSGRSAPYLSSIDWITSVVPLCVLSLPVLIAVVSNAFLVLGLTPRIVFPSAASNSWSVSPWTVPNVANFAAGSSLIRSSCSCGSGSFLIAS